MTITRSPTASGDPAQQESPTAGRLPRPLTPLLGRDDDVRKVRALLATEGVQIVTLLGPGGVGKTRLAIAVAAQAGADYPDGVRFAGLASIRDPALMPAQIARALGIRDQPGTPFFDRVEAMARGWRRLLVVDNLEHLLDTGPVLAQIAERCPGIKLLCTSRTRLAISGEHVYPTAPLARDAAVALFTQRAREISPAYDATGDADQVIAGICDRLDGLPLAIELAAARVPVLPPRELLARLDRRLAALGGGRRDQTDRHRDLRTAVAWSYDLLDPGDQALFRRLAAFSGGFTLEAVTVIASGNDVLDRVARLEASSLIEPTPGSGGGVRFRMLETLREFALEQLASHGEHDLAQRAHAAYIAKLTDGTERIWWEAGGLGKLDELEPEMPNIRAALSWLRQIGDVPALLRIAGSLAPVWATRGYSREGQEWLEWGLARSDDAPALQVTVALRALAWILDQHDDTYRSLLIAQHAYALAEGIGDALNSAGSLILSGIAANRLGHPGWAETLLANAMNIVDCSSGERWAPVCQCVVMNILGQLLIDQGRIDEADILYRRMLKATQSIGFRFTPAGNAHRGLGIVARARGDPRQALVHFQAGVEHAREVRDDRQLAMGLAGIAGALAAQGRFEAAARMFGASEALHERIPYPFASETFPIQRGLGLPEPWASMYPEGTVAEGLRQRLMDRTAALRSVQLDAEQARTWWNAGRELDPESALALIPEMLEAARPAGLTEREVEVLRLLAQGCPDREIAALLFISTRTASNHVHHILTKLDLDSRAAATSWAIRNHLA